MIYFLDLEFRKKIMIYNYRTKIDKIMREQFMRKLRARNDPVCVASRIRGLKTQILNLEATKQDNDELVRLRRLLLGLEKKHNRLVSNGDELSFLS